MEELADGEQVGTTTYRFDAAGRIAWTESMANSAAYTVQTTYRYGGDGALISARDRVLEGPIEEQIGRHAPTVVTTERQGHTVIERRDGPYAHDDSTTTWHFDDRGLVSSVVSPGDRGVEERYCAYDLEGRPIYMARTGEHSFERRWIWSGERLVRVVGSAGGREWSQDVSWRGATLVIGDAEGETVYRGRCDQVLYDVCSTILGPVSPTGRREPLPGPRGRRARSLPRAEETDAFPAAVFAAPLTLRALEAAYPGRSVFTSVTFGESHPEYPVPVVCIGPEEGRCMTQIHHEGRSATRASTVDPTLVAAGLRVGATYASVASLLGECAVVRGPEDGVLCHVRASPHLSVWLTARDADAGAAETPLPASSLENRTVARVDWQASP